MTKVSELVWLWVKRRPYAQEALEKGIVNYSALARMVNREIRASDAAVKAALIRTGARLRGQRKGAEAKVLAVLRNSSLDVRAKVATVVSRDRVEGAIVSAKGPGGWVSVVDEGKSWTRPASARIEKGLDLIMITSSRDIENVSGVIAYIMQRLAAENINIIHMTSASTDTLLVIRDVDTPKAFKILSEMVR